MYLYVNLIALFKAYRLPFLIEENNLRIQVNKWPQPARWHDLDAGAKLENSAN